METLTLNLNVYKFSELSPEAKDRARIWHESCGDWGRDSELMDSIRALADTFGGKVKDWSIDWANSTGPSSMEFDMPEMSASEIRAILRKLGGYNRRTLLGDGDCKLTGVCYDEDAIDGFRIAFIRGKVRDLNALMQAAFETWIKAAWANYEYDYGDEGLSETSDANDWRYLESGKFYVKPR